MSFERDGYHVSVARIPVSILEAAISDSQVLRPRPTGHAFARVELPQSVTLKYEGLRSLQAFVSQAMARELGEIDEPRLIEVTTLLPCKTRRYEIPHVDGLDTENGPFQKPLRTFKLKIGVILADTTLVDRGNLELVPGGHRIVEKALWGKEGEGMTLELQRLLSSKLVPLRLELGQFFAFHPMMPHHISIHLGDYERTACYFEFGNREFVRPR